MTNTAQSTATLIVQLFGRTETTEHADRKEAFGHLGRILANNQLGATADGDLYDRRHGRQHGADTVCGGYRIAGA